MSERVVALYGGSFNPPHLGHVQATSYVLAATDVDEVRLVPVAGHAFAKPLAPFEHRMEMCRRAVRDLRRVTVSDVERHLGSPNRTIDTVRWLMAQEPSVRFDLVVGTDIFAERASWKAFDELERLCRFIVIGRRGAAQPEGHDASPPLFDVSATEIRARIVAGIPRTHLVPLAVDRYIEAHGLYR